MQSVSGGAYALDMSSQATVTIVNDAACAESGIRNRPNATQPKALLNLLMSILPMLNGG